MVEGGPACGRAAVELSYLDSRNGYRRVPRCCHLCAQAVTRSYLRAYLPPFPSASFPGDKTCNFFSSATMDSRHPNVLIFFTQPNATVLQQSIRIQGAATSLLKLLGKPCKNCRISPACLIKRRRICFRSFWTNLVHFSMDFRAGQIVRKLSYVYMTGLTTKVVIALLTSFRC